MRLVSALISVGFLLAGCGGDDLLGIYKVDSMAVDAKACGPGTPVTSPPPYIQLKLTDLLGIKIYGFAACQSADAASCTGYFGLPIYELNSDGGIGYISSAVETSSCTMQYTEGTFTVAGTALAHQQHTYRQSNVSGAPCSQEEAKRRGASMPCVNAQLTLATRVSP